jgi:drug/metabolite transporter (DMT)-like permease
MTVATRSVARARRQGAAGTTRTAAAPSPLAAALSLLAWALASSALIFMNKRIMVDVGFAYPLALTGAGQLVSAACAAAACRAGLWRPRLGPPPPLSTVLTRLLPVCACAAGTLYCGNAAYLTLSVAFIQMLKVLMPALTLAVGVVARVETVTPPLAVAVALMVAGTALATAEEAGGGGGRFSAVGAALFLASAVMEAGRVVAMQALLAGGGGGGPGVRAYTPAEVTAYMGPPTGLLLLAAAAVTERDGLLHRGGLALAVAHAPSIALALFMGFLVNATTAAAIRNSSSLTFKVAGTLKNTAVVLAGVAQGDVVTARGAAGYAVSVAGFGLYTWAKGRKIKGKVG